MRRCLLLPISYDANKKEALNIFNNVETYLKKSKWCYYKSNSPIFDVLSSYKKDLQTVLEKEEVLNIIAQKTKSGSLIRVQLKPLIQGIEVNLSIIGENGRYIYYQDKAIVNAKEANAVSQTIKNKLEIYRQSIPYHGLISGVLGDHFTIDAGSDFGIQEGTVLTVLRSLEEKKHPLLKKIVDWETTTIGRGKILRSARNTAEGKMIEYESTKRLKKGDWVKIRPAKVEIETEIKKYHSKNEYRFGRLGELGLFLPLGRHLANIGNAAKKFGPLLGLDLTGELWVTRKWWIGMDFSQNYGLFNRDDDVFHFNEASYFRLKGGYKYLPLGFFYGPRIDFFVGHARAKYFLKKPDSHAESFFSFKGPLVGGKGILPIRKMLSLYLNVEMIFNPTYAEEFGSVLLLHGREESASHLYLEFGASYRYNPRIRVTGAYRMSSVKAELVDPEETLRIKNSSFTSGIIFTF